VKSYICELLAKIDLNVKFFEAPIISSKYIELSDETAEVRINNKKLYIRSTISIPYEFIPQHKDIKDKVIGFFEYAIIHRAERDEDLIPCIRHRLFTVPLLHMISRDLEELMKKYLEINDIIMKEPIKYGQKYFIKITLSSKTLDNMKKLIDTLARKRDSPILLEVLEGYGDKQIMNIGYYILDHNSKPVKIASVMLETCPDIYILHVAPIGSIERYLYMIFDSTAKLHREGKTPYLPLWLSPIQVRLIPIKQEYLEYTIKIAEKLLSHGIRVDVDDRWIGLGKRIRDAGKEWIPYIIVIGEREIKSNTLNIRIRRTNDQMVMDINEFINYLKSELKGYPRIRQLYPLMVSKRI
jgi:threonyl-tRNA synthetase